MAGRAVEDFDRESEIIASKTLRLGDAEELKSQIAKVVRDSKQPCFVILSGSQIGLRRRLEDGLLIGRDPNAGLTLADVGVSFRHARVEDRGDSWAIVDLQSTNGTRVNGVLKEESVLSPGDRITLGVTTARYEVRDAMDQAFDQEVERLINIDDLSGLYVRRKFDQELQTLIEAARQHGEDLGLIVMDLDGIKSINDTHGHRFGAYVIGEAGKVIGKVLGRRGIAARFGGDEYVAAFPKADLEATETFAREIIDAIHTHEFNYEGEKLQPGISIGVASFPRSAGDAETLFQRGDEAMYRAKRSGKNRICR